MGFSGHCEPLKWGNPTKAKLVDVAMPAPFPEAISKAPWIIWISGCWGPLRIYDFGIRILGFLWLRNLES